MKARFVISLKDKKYAKGILYILSDANQILFEHIAWSGALLSTENNKGYLPEGEYLIESIRFTSEPAYTINNYGWVAGIMPKFTTDRNNLAIHPDGGFPGSAGCIVSTFSLDQSVKLHNFIEEGLTKGFIPLTVMYVGQPSVAR